MLGALRKLASMFLSNLETFFRPISGKLHNTHAAYRLRCVIQERHRLLLHFTELYIALKPTHTTNSLPNNRIPGSLELAGSETSPVLQI